MGRLFISVLILSLLSASISLLPPLVSFWLEVNWLELKAYLAASLIISTVLWVFDRAVLEVELDAIVNCGPGSS